MKNIIIKVPKETITYSKLKFIILTIKYINGIKYNIDTMPDFLIRFTIVFRIIYFPLKV